jgi:hypothetical protein
MGRASWLDFSRLIRFDFRLFDASKATVSEPLGRIMTTLENDKSEEQERYAACCLKAAPGLPDQESRRIIREMATEWLRLAEAIQGPSRSELRKMG